MTGERRASPRPERLTARGSFRDAVSTLDQLSAATDAQITVQAEIYRDGKPVYKMPTRLLEVTPGTNPKVVIALLAYMSPCTTVVRAEVLRCCGGFYDRDRCMYAEDAHLWLKVLLNEAVAVNLEP